jgi:hypothetical protein
MVLSGKLSLKRLWADIPKGAVATVSIIVDFYILENGFPHFSSGCEMLTVDYFYLQRVEEAFRTGIVITVACAAHAAHQGVPHQGAIEPGVDK